jgi:predicted RNA binding protein YcfA (HicA-like mRNA interferase family)
MTAFPSITGSRLIRALRKLGFEVIRVKGSHYFLRHQDGRY